MSHPYMQNQSEAHRPVRSEWLPSAKAFGKSRPRNQNFLTSAVIIHGVACVAAALSLFSAAPMATGHAVAGSVNAVLNSPRSLRLLQDANSFADQMLFRSTPSASQKSVHLLESSTLAPGHETR